MNIPLRWQGRWFAVTMGTGIVAVLMNSVPFHTPVLYYLSIVFFLLNVVIFFLAFVTSVLRYTLYPEIWRVMIQDPTNSLFLATLPMGFATLIEMWVFICVPRWGTWATSVAWALWMVDVVAAASVTMSLSFILISQRYITSLDRITALQLLPIAATIVAAGTGAEVAHILQNKQHAMGTLLVSFVLWGMGTPLAIFVLVIYYQRLAVHKLPPREAIVSCFLPLGPLGFGGFGIIYIGKVARELLQNSNVLDPIAGSMAYVLGVFISLLMWSFGLIWLVFALATILYSSPFPFNMGWWGFTFPLGVYAANTMELGKELDLMFFKVFGTDSAEHEFPFLQEVYTPRESHKVDFVFVHGLNPRGRNDHPFETWTHANGKFWPRDFLAEDLPYSRVFVYGYNSNITNPQTMSTASIKDHANTLLNLLDMERGPQLHSMPPKIIFIGHSLGGLVIKQALLNAKEDPKYNSIRTATSGLVFFGTPHRGAKAVELGKIAARVARFVSKGHASNDLLDCLEHNSLFTRQMTDRFRHQLEDYRVVSFIEGKEVLLGGVGPASLSHLVVDEESAVLGLSGLRETQLKLDADHSQMCKVGSRGPMYRLIKGNIKQLVDQALLAEQGFIPQPSPHQTTGPTPPPVPPRMHSNSSAPYSPPGRPPAPAERVVGTIFTPIDNDPRSIRAAELKNRAKWDEARNVEYEIFQEHLRTLGADHLSTLSVGYNLAEIELESSFLQKANEWCQWVVDSSRRVFGNSHAMSLKAESLMAETLCQQGKHHEAESISANVLARQQMSIGEDHLDTLETRRRLGMAYNSLNRRESALMTAEKLTNSIKRLLGDNHIRVFAAALDQLEYMIYNHGDESAALITVFAPEVQQAFELLPSVYEELRAALGDRHPLTIRSLSLHGRGLTRAHQSMEASEVLRRALAISEESMGPDHPLTIDIVGSIGVMYTLQDAMKFTAHTGPPSEAIPWLVRYLNWVERRRGLDNPETQSSLEMLGNLHFAAKEYETAQKYFERALASCREPGATAMQQRINNQLQLCRANTMLFTNRQGMGSGLGGF
ncbi:Tetratricopeptide-like helical [Penicillium macrosclerotiorum]|uniref:Tetratricopeptide-like helical n=1 Tax=Penicillium macrosclerotiorum TaxID=303699 RepID=UPI0025485EFE|nr:Tetratricopeptide-like helical [Penicillium macrosclerotiorum]KAJ5692770.1 Tetratricopeptide-like helical [Penicillium macrosclerotiorum]